MSKGIELSMFAIVAITLGLLVLLIVAMIATGGGKDLSNKLKGFTDTATDDKGNVSSPGGWHIWDYSRGVIIKETFFSLDVN